MPTGTSDEAPTTAAPPQAAGRYPARQLVKPQATSRSEETRSDPTPNAEIAISEPRGQTAQKPSSTPSVAPDARIDDARDHAAGATTEKQAKTVGIGATSAPAERKSSGRTNPPTTATATAGAESKGSSEDEVAETTDAAPEARVARSVDTSLLQEGLDWEYCGLRPAPLGPAVLPPQPSSEDRLFLSADTFDYDQELDLLWLSGDVRLVQGSRRVAADKIIYDRNTADLVAKGNVFLANPGIRLVADEAQMNMESDKGSLTDVQYRLTGKINARGIADEAELVQPTRTRYRNILYTSCRPGQNAWTLDAADLELDQDTGRGLAHNAKLRVRGVPVLYAPYMSFPIDDRRKSGILVPTIGSSDTNGVDVTVPYYWNIAPNMDATVSPRYMSKRGLMLGSEFRYLSPRQEAEIYGEILPEDSQLEDKDTRWAYRIEQTGRFGRRWTTAINYNAVSDDEYLEDFGNNLDLTSTRNIERRADLRYSGDGWYLLTRLQGFQTLDPTIPPEDEPYARLPQLLFRKTPYVFDSGAQLGVGGEYDYFEHDEKVRGHRAALQPYARWPLRRSYGHLIPQLNLYLAEYDLLDQDPGKDERPSYAIPSFNLDGQLIFERAVEWLEQESLQTIEPRIFYLYTPFADQEDIPVFDSTDLSFSYYSLFQPNRFAGWDRIGDANQLTIGITSRTLARDSGQELLRASIGQILYFRDRDVQLYPESSEESTSSTSSIAGLLSAQLLENWTGRASFEYDPDEDTDPSPKRSLAIHYRTSDDRVLNLAYRFDLGASEDTGYEDTDLSFRLPVNGQMQIVGRWNYSLLNSQTVEAFAGIEYGQCCWRMRLVGRHLKNQPDSAGNTSIMVQVELAGLGSIGQQVDKLFEQGIYGYQLD